jgi:hypothetical protein
MLTFVTSCKQETKIKSKGWLKQFPCDVMLRYTGEKNDGIQINCRFWSAVFRKEKQGNRRRMMQVISVQEVEREEEKQLHSYYY